jgi:hypothetical protein
MNNGSCSETTEENCPSCGNVMLPMDEFGTPGCGCLELVASLGRSVEKN